MGGKNICYLLGNESPHNLRHYHTVSERNENYLESPIPELGPSKKRVGRPRGGGKKYRLLTVKEQEKLSSVENNKIYNRRFQKYIAGRKRNEIPPELLASNESPLKKSHFTIIDKREGRTSKKGRKKGKGKLSTLEARREYQRRYYQMHKEKAKEYQRQYNLTHKRKARGGRGKANFVCPKEVVRLTYHPSDLMHSPVEKTLKMLEKIISGERLFTM